MPDGDGDLEITETRRFFSRAPSLGGGGGRQAEKLVCSAGEMCKTLRDEPVSRKKMQGPGAKVQESQKDE